MPTSVEPRHELFSSGLSHEPVRPLVMGRTQAIATGHYLATVAGQRIFDLGGTAIDAGIAAGLCINVLLFTRADFGGVAPIILHHAPTGRTVTFDGVGVWPARTDIEHLRAAGPAALQGIHRAVTPGAPDAWLTALAEFGTLTVGEIFEPAYVLAAEGAPISTGVARNLADWKEHVCEHYPTTFQAFYPDGRALRAGELFRRPALAHVLKSLMDAEAAALREGADRRSGIRAARDVIYRGWVAHDIARYFEESGGWMRLDDLGRHAVELSEPVKATYRGYEVQTCGPWSQGPVLLQALNILEVFDLGELGPDSVAYFHILIEAIDRAYADRNQFYGDPRFVDVPLDGLMSKSYATERAATIEVGRASGAMPEPGNPWAAENRSAPADRRIHIDVDRYRASHATGQPRFDTSHCAAVDAEGNFFSATPSDPGVWAPVIPQLGFACSGRGVQSWLDAGHPGCAGPGRRPRMTPNPVLVSQGGQPLLGLGCPGGDAQPQGMLQVLLNLFEFGMNLQQAIEAPRVVSWNFPNSFAPHPYHPGLVDVERRVPAEVRVGLRGLGHVCVEIDDYAPSASSVHAVTLDRRASVVGAAADPRVEGSASAW